MAFPKGAVAIDLGATSCRFAEGRIEAGKIVFRVVEQVEHGPSLRDGRYTWDLDLILRLCRSAIDFAKANFEEATVAIDSWGVDHGFIDREGQLMQPIVAYRDPSHAAAMDEHRDLRKRLFELTGIQNQPFNTFYQLLARRKERPELTEKGQWLLLPDLLGFLLAGHRGYEATMSSTTQLMGLDGRWSPEAFALVGWPVPEGQPGDQAQIRLDKGIRLVKVGSHDTASAVYGIGNLKEDQAFLNVGTWSLLGCLLNEPLTSEEAREQNFTNERAVNGRVRFLRNIPGFYVINRLHQELGVKESVPEWLAGADLSVEGRIDLLREEFFNPDSMIDAVIKDLNSPLPNAKSFAGLALLSLATTTSDSLDRLQTLTGRVFREVRIAGGGSASKQFCQVLADVSGRTVLAGPVEATVVGNLARQFVLSGEISSEGAGELISSSCGISPYSPKT